VPDQIFFFCFCVVFLIGVEILLFSFGKCVRFPKKIMRIDVFYFSTDRRTQKKIAL